MQVQCKYIFQVPTSYDSIKADVEKKYQSNYNLYKNVKFYEFPVQIWITIIM